MASKKKNAIGCRAGRARIVDPNDFDGFDADSNVPVQLEDLNISVALTSFRKGRTLLTGELTDSSKSNVAQISVNFIEGTNLGGKKVLTTSYTDLTTRFDSDVVNDEALGITNIDIEFNASMAPLITINFIDVRGSAVFQNEENILNNRGNKYTTFFQLPYPMYELEVKGYYGLPVKYCLHMLKFNSKFGIGSSLILSNNCHVLRCIVGSPPVIRMMFNVFRKSGHHFQNASTYGFSSSR